MEVKIEIETFNKQLDFDLFETKERLARGMEIKIADGISARFEGTEFHLAIGFPDLVHFTITIGKDLAIGVASGIISAWLYNKLKGRKVEKLRIERTEVNIDKGEIKRILMEKIEEERV